jgi:hypothetical protein
MTTTTSAAHYTAKGKITAVRDNGVVVFAPAGTNYELHLVSANGKYAGPIGKPVEGIIRVKARKIWTVSSGGNFVSPLFGEPRTIQGRVRHAPSDQTLVIHAGTNFHLELPPGDAGVDLTAGPIRAGAMVNVMAMPAPTFELAGAVAGR